MRKSILAFLKISSFSLPAFGLVSLVSSCGNSSPSDDSYKQNNMWILNKYTSTNSLFAYLIFDIDANFESDINISIEKNDNDIQLEKKVTKVVDKKIIVNFVINSSLQIEKDFTFSVIFNFINSYGNKQNHEFQDLHVSFLPKYDDITVEKSKVITVNHRTSFYFDASALPQSPITLSLDSSSSRYVSLESSEISIKSLKFEVWMHISEEVKQPISLPVGIKMNFVNSYGLPQEEIIKNLFIEFNPIQNLSQSLLNI